MRLQPARTHPAPDASRAEVHAYVLDGAAPGSARPAASGPRAAVEATAITEFEGLPCTPCLLAYLAHLDAPDAASRPAPPPVPSGRDGNYAADLRGEEHYHLVEPGAPRGSLDGRGVVHTACARLAWGPLTSTPEPRALCVECRGIAVEDLPGLLARAIPRPERPDPANEAQWTPASPLGAQLRRRRRPGRVPVSP